MNLEDLKEKLVKMKSLAERGEGGERETANRLIEELAAKYGISLDFLGNETKRHYEIRFSAVWQRRLFGQLMGLLRLEKYGSRDADELILYFNRRDRLKCNTTCTEMEWLELTTKHSVLCADYKRQQRAFYTAFLMANDLLMPFDPKSPPPTPKEEKEYDDAFSLSAGIKRSEIFTQIGYESEGTK